MTNIDVDHLPLAATRQTWRAKSVRDLLVQIIAAHPTATEDVLRKKFKERMREDDEFFNSTADYAFDGAMRAYAERRRQRRVR